MSDKEEVFEHESYGIVQFNRHQGGGGRLFGSSVTNHLSTISLVVRAGTMHHDLHEDRFCGSFTKDYIEVEMSAAQFAELLTTMNMGSGVPCTIRYFNGKRVENPPEIKATVERVRDNFKLELNELTVSLQEKAKNVKKLLEKKVLNKKDKETINWVFGKIIQDVQSNFPFVLEQFNRATEKVVTAGKAEIDNFITSMIHKTGLQQLQAMSSRPMLEAPGEEE